MISSVMSPLGHPDSALCFSGEGFSLSHWSTSLSFKATGLRMFIVSVLEIVI